ncbi:sulfotransferase domain-containing protein [Alkalibacillus almallahensis]|uniref:sulfotransferase domain-containing protein n=1 Tax=Alkalibacillus almallahensis TaxID=1379154 RepID=UPI001423B4DA|nr:sulfotransferase domain-containing protein [Alkalibacillus almallahensis]NIK11788.1 hypothetical protein [Alkalibacillus almallahensis]
MLKKIVLKAYNLVLKNYKNMTSEINKDAIFVLGNQKSGTSAIVGLLAGLSDKSVTIDTKGIYEPIQSNIHSGNTSFSTFVKKNKYDFSPSLIKEPSFTFLYKDIRNIFNSRKNVFIVRDPRDNIRSILNRLNLPGHVENFEYDTPELWETVSEDWKLTITNNFLHVKSSNDIGKMAERWVKAIEVYEQYQDEFVLLRYEEFKMDKNKEIKNLAKKLDLPEINDISSKLDHQFQPKGNNDMSHEDFFGKNNLELINSICEKHMKKYGYK